jgi:hypothetical protein
VHVSTWRALVVVLSAILLAPVGVAYAAPGDPDHEGSNPSLKNALEAASRGYLDAQAALEASKKRQAELTSQLAGLEPRIAELGAQAQRIAVAAYRNGGVRTAATLLTAGSAETFVDKASTLQFLARHDDRLLRELTALRTKLTETKASIDAEIVKQQQHLELMAKKKKEAEKALTTVGGTATTGPATNNAPRAQPAPRRPDGSWPPESCRLNDPTTSGCITARTLHAFQQARAAGFTRFCSCYRPGGPYEHPKGRACDFSAQANGFGGVATGAEKVYGDNLAAFFVRNASQLAVLYVIWYERIWLPSSGWRAYRSGRGDPSSDHTNHVHLSVY